MDKEKITVWITKWALKSGVIVEIEGEVVGEGVVGCGRKFGYLYGKEWHRTRAAAIKRAEQMRLKKIASLKKQLENLEKIRFE